MVIDEKPIRRRAIAKCRYVLKQFDSVLEDLDRHEAVDRPAFHRWLHTTFASELSDLRETHEQTRYLQSLLDQIDDLHVWEGMSYREAYRVARDMHEHPERYSDTGTGSRDGPKEADPEGESPYADEEEDFDPGGFSEEDLHRVFQELFVGTVESASPDPDSDEYRRLFALFKASMASMFGHEVREEQLFEEFYQGVSGLKPDGPATAAERARETHVKNCYRSLAKKLHPDNRANKDMALNELWYRVQEAYGRRDLQELRMLEAAHDVRNAVDISSLPVGRILAVHRDYLQDLRLLRRRHRDLRKDDSWAFTGKSEQEIAELRALHTRQIAAEYRELLTLNTHLEARLQLYAGPPRRRTGKRAWSPPPEQLSLFDD